MKTIKWGIIGPGNIAHKFAQGILSVPHAELYAIASRSHTRAQDFAHKYGATKVYDSYEDLVTDDAVDVVYVATTNNLHFEHTKMCIENNKACLCEKPFTCNYEELIELIELAHAKQVFLMEAMWTRFLPSILAIEKHIQNDELGAITHIESTFGFTTEYNPDSRLYNPDLGGGALLDIGIYPVFLAQHFLGKPQKIEADVLLTDAGVDKEESIRFYYENSVYAELQSSFIRDLPCTSTIYGTKGYITLEKMWHCPTTVIKKTGTKTEDITPTYIGNGYNYEIEEVVCCLNSNQLESLRMSHSNSLERMKLLDEIQFLWKRK
ncbi:MAG: Gfo/Idh/MocA family oxidoreductase [Bacteroidales bacterium]